MNEREKLMWWITNETADKVIDRILKDRKELKELKTKLDRSKNDNQRKN